MGSALQPGASAKMRSDDIGAQRDLAVHLLVVEDDRNVREPLTQYLIGNQCRVTQAANAWEARKLLKKHDFDLVILDVMMPGEDGLSLCRYIRAAIDLPVVLLTAKAEETDRIVGLEIGADDYVVKPFSPRELLARIKAIIRRARSIPRTQSLPEAKVILFGIWTLKTAERELVGEDGVVVPLSTGEFKLLLNLAQRPRTVLSRDQLLELTQGRDATIFDRSVDNQISRLRKKIEPDVRTPVYIKTVWGGGYIFAADVRQL
jgi:two-component system OmpR family response regulator